jgi:hypothetical protein
MAALLGTLPIALGYGAGGEARRPLGLTVVGGLLTPTRHALPDTRHLHLHGRADEPSESGPQTQGGPGSGIAVERLQIRDNTLVSDFEERVYAGRKSGQSGSAA